MITLFWIFVALAIVFFVSTIVSMFICRTLETMTIPCFLNIGTAVCALICSIINMFIN